MTDAQIDRQAAMIDILQAAMDLQAENPRVDLTQKLPQALPHLPRDEFHNLVIILKSSRCLDASLSEGAGGEKIIESINGVSTRGLRELQKSWEAPSAQHSCPTDGDDGRIGFAE